ncbi:extracellular solute-binding protein [Aestuariimicrobium ganziense]|uniref:extracellular solute-binding protein n=1 Tax=Aestuariimicrobium ganziense TaxID=2773677 RepID=UPI001942F8B1|nr:extracellular solute-binding protein [Aestuariimicrobium ganziense]
MVFKNDVSRRWLLGAAGVSGLAGLSACAAKAGNTTETPDSGGGGGSASGGGGGDNVPGRQPASGTITVLGSTGEHPKESLDDFTKLTGIKVNFQEFTFDKLVSMVAAGNAPDVARGQGGTDTAYLYSRKLAEPLDEYLKNSEVLKADDLAPINDVWKYDGSKQGQGQQYGLVKDYSSDFCLWVNTDLCPGVKAGDLLTYDQVKQFALDATKITGGRQEIYGYEFYDTKPHVQWLNTVAGSKGVNIFNDDMSEIDLTSDPCIQAFEWVRELVEKKATWSVINKSAVGSFDSFKAGRLAVLQSGYWTQGMWGDAKPDMLKKMLMIPAPTFDGGERVSPVLAGTGLWIPAGAKNKAGAWKFFEHFFKSGKVAKDRASSGWGVPALKSMMDLMPTETELNKAVLATQQEEDKYLKVLNFTPYARIDAVQTAITGAFDKMITGKTGTADMAKKATDDINALLKRGKR